MKKPVIFLGSLLVLTLVVIFGRDFAKGKVNSNSLTRITQTQSKKEVPQYVVYHMMFRHVVWLQSKADELQAQGKDGSAYRNRYQRFAGLTDKENQLLNQTAKDTVNKVKEIDEQIEALVKADREKRKSQYAGKPVPLSPSPLNPEVTRLDLERRNAIQAGYGKLHDGFEGWRFAAFEKFVQKEIASQIHTNQSFPNLQRIPADVPRTGLSKGGK